MIASETVQDLSNTTVIFEGRQVSHYMIDVVRIEIHCRCCIVVVVIDMESGNVMYSNSYKYWIDGN